MTLAFLTLPPHERKLYVDEAAARLGLSPVIIEKDFWVCWLRDFLAYRLDHLDTLVNYAYWEGVAEATGGGHVIKF